MLAALAVGFSMQAPGVALADASSSPTISIAAISPTTQESGVAFTYRVSYECSNVNASPCAVGPTVTIPLGAAADPTWNVAVGESPLITSWDLAGGNLVVELEDLVEGVSGSIGITITPPNRTTPNGTSWTLTPTMTFDDDTPTVTTSGVTSTATSEPSLSIVKRIAQEFYRPGDLTHFTITSSCPGSGVHASGVEDLASLRIVDTLPDGLTYVSSEPAATTVAGQTVTWEIPYEDIGHTCVKGQNTSTSLEITARVDASVSDGTRLTNGVSAYGESLSGASIFRADNDALTVVSDIPAPGTSKTGTAPLIHLIGDGLEDPTLNGYRSGTYAGDWLGAGDRLSESDKLDMIDARDSRIESVYTVDVTMPMAGLQTSIIDPLPCTSNVTGVSYSSNDPGDLCADPAWHLTRVTVDARTNWSATNVGIPAAFVPVARLSDGSTVPLIVAPVHSGAAMQQNGPAYRTYHVPESAIGRVAEIEFPRTDGMTNTRFQIVLGGYADAERVGGDILRNVAEISAYGPGDTAPYNVSNTSVGRLFVLDGPQIGIYKYWQQSGSQFKISAHAMFSGPTSGDLTIVDAMPEGIQFTGPVNVRVIKLGLGTPSTLPDAEVTTVADPLTGQTTLSIRIPEDVLNRLIGDEGGQQFRFDIDVPSTAIPGNYTNTATVNLSDPGTNSSLCLRGTAVAGTAGAGFECEDSVEFLINPDPASDAVRVSKAVRGSEDANFKTFPAIGYVASTGGSATYRLTWENKSFQDVGNVVAYDLLPRVGDTGTVAGTVGQQRGSTFQPTLTGVGSLPAGVTAQYSTSDNPCRPEVLPNADNPGCDDDWVALPSSPSAALLASVQALRFASSATYAFDTGFEIQLSMTTPPLTSPDEIAWNTFATAQTNVEIGQPIAPVESAKVGIARRDYSHITIDKVVDEETAHVGDTLTYTVTAVNDGGRDLTDITLRDILPDDVDFVSASHGGVHDDGVITWTLDEMPLGQVFTFTIEVEVTGGEGETLVNRWEVDGPTPVTPEHPCEDDPTQSCAETEVPTVELNFDKTSDPAPGTAVAPGDEITYSVTIENDTDSPSTSGVVTDDMTDVLDKATMVSEPVVSCAPSGNSCGEVAYTAGEDEFTWQSTSSDPLDANTTATVTYTVVIDEDATGTVGNLLVEPDVLVEHPIIEWSKTNDVGDGVLVDAGDTVVYTISVSNTGTVDAAEFSAVDDLSDVVDDATFDVDSIVVTPAGLGVAVFDPAAETLTWTGALAAGQTVEVSYAVTVNEDAAGELRNAFFDTTVVNPISAALQWNKVDDTVDAGLLAGAEWELTPLDGDGEPAGDAIVIVDCVEVPCTGADTDPVGGQFLVTGLEPGDYELVETKAPFGFVLDTTPIAVTVSAAVTVTVLDDIVNVQQSVPVLPFTGGLGVEQLWLIGGGLLLLMLALAVWQVMRRRAQAL